MSISISIASSGSQDLGDKDNGLISSSLINSNWNPNTDKVEFFIYDELKNLIYEDYNFNELNVVQFNPDNSVSEVEINIEQTLSNLGFYNGNINLNYNFVRYELSSSIDNKYYISEISSDRTELKIKSNNSQSYNFDTQTYFDELYLNFGSNKYAIAINLEAENDFILVKLYEALNSDFDIKSSFYFISKTAESLHFDVAFPVEYEPLFYTKLKGPNYSLENNGIISTLYQNEQDILSTSLTSSYSQLKSIINSKKLGVDLYNDYFDWGEFVKFSSAYQRIINFNIKAASIESYRNEINILNTLDTSSGGLSSSLSVLYNNIQNIIVNFDNYEYYLYFDSSSYSWPKTNNTPPYLLYSTSSVQALTWMGSLDELSPYYGGMLLSSSLYDEQNQDNLVNVIPEFIRENSDNNNYILFSNMVGQFFDDIWLYAKHITQKYNADNRLNYGSPKDLVDEILDSLGVTLYKNNKFSENLYSSYIGIGLSGSLLYPTSSTELITQRIDINSGSLIPFNIIDIDKELYKRLYHNLIYILKKKGTSQGLKELINLYGIPPTILRINEYGQRNNNPDEDYVQRLFNYAFYTNRPPTGSYSGVRIPFRTPSSSTTKPKGIAFRFKPKRVDTISNYSQSLFYVGQIAGGEPTLKRMYFVIEYTGSLQSGSYSGSIIDPRSNWAHVKLILSSSTNNSASIYAPVFNGNWWSVLLNKENDKVTFYLKSKYDDLLNNTIYFEGSASITTLTGSWDFPNDVDSRSILRLGVGDYSGSNGKYYKFFEGYFQEFRYYSSSLDITSFDSFVLNPLSLESNYLNSYNNLFFRAPLGTDLIVSESDLRNLSLGFDSGCYDLISMHPATTGSSPTASFPPNILVVNSNRYLTPESSSYNISWSFEPNKEYIYLKEPIVGLANRLSNKIQIETTQIPSGNVLSSLGVLQQNSNYYKKDANILEVVFSPQDEVNDDISEQLGNFNIGSYINHEYMYSSSYSELNTIRNDYFKKYIKPYNIWDYFRLIKYYDNSLFKTLKDFIPVNTNLDSGILVKSHLLERNKYKTPQPTVENNLYTASIEIASITGSYGNNLEETLIDAIMVEGAGSPEVNGLYLRGISLFAPTSSIYPQYVKTIPSTEEYDIYHDGIQYVFSDAMYYNTNTSSIVPWIGNWELNNGSVPAPLVRQATLLDAQRWNATNVTVLGNIDYLHNSLDELVNGEFSGSQFSPVTQSLIYNQEILTYPDVEIYYNISLFNTSGTFWASQFFNVNTAPSGGELYLLYDAGIQSYPIGFEL